MSHGKPIIGYRNNLKGATFRAGSQVQAAPASNLATDIGAEPWQTAGVRTAENGAWVEIDAGEEVPWRAFLLGRTNLTSDAAARFMAGAPTNGMVLDGGGGTYASTPHKPEYEIIGDMTVISHFALSAEAGGSYYHIVARYNNLSNSHFVLGFVPDGRMHFRTRDIVSGGARAFYADVSTLDITRPVWVAVSLRLDDGEGNAVATFYTSRDGDSWEILVVDPRPSIAGLDPLGIQGLGVGATQSGDFPFDGDIFCAQVYSGAGFDLSSGPTGTLVADFNPEDTAPGSTEFTSTATGETWTLHGNAAIEREFLPTYDSGWIGGLMAGYQQLVHLADADIMARHLRIEVDDPDNPDGFVRIGLAYGGPVFQPQRGIEYGANFGVAGLRQDITTRGGQTYPVALYQQRQWQVSFPALTEPEMYGEGLEIQRCAEMGGNVLFVPRPGNGLEQQEAVFGMLQSRATFGFPHYGLRSWAFTITERL